MVDFLNYYYLTPAVGWYVRVIRYAFLHCRASWRFFVPFSLLFSRRRSEGRGGKPLPLYQSGTITPTDFIEMKKDGRRRRFLCCFERQSHIVVVYQPVSISIITSINKLIWFITAPFLPNTVVNPNMPWKKIFHLYAWKHSWICTCLCWLKAHSAWPQRQHSVSATRLDDVLRLLVTTFWMPSVIFDSFPHTFGPTNIIALD